MIEFESSNMLDGAEYSSTSEYFADLETKIKKKKKKSKNKIRFSDEQIRSLEVMFESETKLDPRKKVQLAKELCLQPRQVAIWFQNKRARWKSKQIEKDYNVLLSDYNNLASRFDSLKKDNQSLLIQLEKLKNEMVGTGTEGMEIVECKNQEKNMSSSTSSDDGELSAAAADYNKKMDFDFELLGIGMDHEQEEEDDELLIKMVGQAEDNHSPLVTTSHEDWGSTIDSDYQTADQNYLSWDFWS